MNKTVSRLLLLTILIITSFLGCSHLPIPGFENFLSVKERALQTGIDDAKTDIPFLDNFNPNNLAYMTVLSRTSSGSYLLQPGLFEMHCESYCLKPGTYGPTEGDGYIYAPLKGPRAEVIKKILRQSVNHPDIEQRDKQLLIWAIIARSKVEDISPNARMAAIKMLTPKEIIEINGGAISLIPDDLFEKFLSGLPEPLQSLIETESKIRGLISKSDATYEEIEKVAVLFGEPGDSESKRNIPEGRWSLHPEGYFVRFFPSGYTRTLLQIYVPERFEIEKDKYNRIIRIEDTWGNTIETEYKDSIIRNYTPNENKLNIYAFKTIRFSRIRDGFFNYMDFSDLEYTNTGWTLQGNPSGQPNTETSVTQEQELKERLKWSIEHKKQIEKLDKQFKGKAPIPELLNLAMYYQAINESIKGHELTGKNPWALETCLLIQRAWQSLLCKSETGIIRENYVLDGLYAELSGMSGNTSSVSVESEPAAKSGTDSDKKKRKKKSKDGKDDKDGSDSPGSAPAISGKQLNGNSNKPVLCSDLEDAIGKLEREIKRQELWIQVVEDHPEAIGLCENGADWRNFIDALFNLIASQKGLGPVNSTPFTFITKPSGEIVFITPPDGNGNRYELTLMDKNGNEIPTNIDLAKRFLRDSYGNPYLGDIMFDIFYNYHEKSHLEDYKAGKNKDTPSAAAAAEIKAFKKAIEAKKKALKDMKERLKNKDCIK